MAESSLRKDRRSRIAWLAGLFLASTLPGCGVPSAEDTVTVDGSSTVYRISTAAEEGFRKVNTEVAVIVGNSGTGGGFTKYNRGDLDIVDASRPAEPAEESKAKAAGMDWLKFVVGYDGITVVVNPKNTFVQDLSVEQLKRLFEPDSQVKTWKDLDPAWPDREIKLYTPDDKSGTFEFFTEAVVGKPKSQRKDVTPSSDDNTLVLGVAGDPDAIGYFGYAYFKEYSDKLRAIPIKENKDAPAVAPDPATILDKTYPISRPLFIFVKKKSYRRPGVAAFVKYYLDNIAELATQAKYVAPTPEDIKANEAEAKPVEAKPTP